MKTLKSGLFSLLVLFAMSFSNPALAGNIDDSPNATNNSLRNQLTKMVQNPNLQEHGLSEAELYLQFKVTEDGEILLLAVNTDSDYMLEFAKEKLHRKKIDLIDVPPNAVYTIRIKFELQ